MLTFSRVFLIFLAYSFLGWCMEVIYVGLFVEHKFVNRGMLHGPICPIYGFGGLIVLLGLERWKDTWIELFFASMFLCSLLEYVTSWILEKLFQTKWWDYSDQKFNLNGRVCMLNSVLFGLGGMLFAHFVHPFVMWIVMAFSDTQAEWTARGLSILLSTDIIITAGRLVNFSNTMSKLKEFTESLQERFAGAEWFRNESLSEMLASIRQQSQLHKEQFNQALLDKVETFSRHQKNAESFLKRFPTMSSRTYTMPLSHIRTSLKAGIEERKAIAHARREARKQAE